MASDNTPTSTRRGSAERNRPAATIGWSLHYLLRLGIAWMLFAYGWMKVFLVQMGRPDFADALVAYGEMSPMGLLWRAMGFSPEVQFVAGLAEVTAGALLLWRRTALLGALLGALDMWIVFGMNLYFDVPVKQLTLALALGCTVLLLPFLPAMGRGLLGREVGRLPLPTAVTGGLGRVTGVLAIVIAVGATAGSGTLIGMRFGAPQEATSGPLVGVHQVVADRAEPAPQLAQDTRWQQIAFGQWSSGEGRHRVSIRFANGDLRTGTYRVDGDRVTLDLQPVLEGAAPVNQPTTDTWELTFSEQPDGTIHLVGSGQDLDIVPDPEFRFLFDRDFAWAPRQPVNR